MALTRKNIKDKMLLLGVFSEASLPIIDQLIKVDKMIEQMQKSIDKHGVTLVQKSREGHDRLVTNPVIQELTKQQSLKAKLFDQLLLTPQALSKTNIQQKDDDGFEDMEK